MPLIVGSVVLSVACPELSSQVFIIAFHLPNGGTTITRVSTLKLLPGHLFHDLSGRCLWDRFTHDDFFGNFARGQDCAKEDLKSLPVSRLSRSGHDTRGHSFTRLRIGNPYDRCRVVHLLRRNHMTVPRVKETVVSELRIDIDRAENDEIC